MSLGCTLLARLLSSPSVWHAVSRADIRSAGGWRHSSEVDQTQSYVRTGEQPSGWFHRQDVA
jgi:hypothetical protein